MKCSFWLFLVIIALVTCCNVKQSENPPAHSLDKDTLKLKYATGFSIMKDSAYTRIVVRRPYQGANQALHYILVPRNMDIPEHDPQVKVIRVPVNNIVCTSTTHIPLLDYLDETEKLVGFPTTDYISSTKARRLIDDGKVVDLGVDKGINIELLSSLQPELLMGYTMNADFGQFKKIEELGIPVILNSEYLERHPLGRAEWIKFIAPFFGKEKVADSVFNSIEKNYLATRQLVAELHEKPSALSGIMYGDAWFLPGGKNYAATILEDAGYRYFWEDDLSSGFLELSFETVLARAHSCDYWIGVGPFQSLAEIEAADHRYKQFNAFKNKNVYSYDARKGAKGGNEYLELGYLRPDLILRDLVKIAHPDLIPDHDLFFHRRLR
jgi:iron complex transport system substrate-binding protein